MEPQVGLSSRRPSRRRLVLREETRSRERSCSAPSLAPSPWLGAPCTAETPVPFHPLRLELSSSPARSSPSPPRTPHPAGPPRSPRINKCAPCARGSSGRSRLSLSQCHVLTFWVLAPKISSRTAVPFPPLPLFLSPFPFPFSACDQ